MAGDTGGVREGLLDAEASPARPPGVQEVLREACRSGVCYCVPVVVLSCLANLLVVGFLPTLLANFFASRAAGHAVSCEGFKQGALPPACVEATSVLVEWGTWTDLACNTLGFVCMPLVGAVSDRSGRVPFLALIAALALLPQAALLLFHLGVVRDLRWYYVAQAAASGVQTISLLLAYVADRVRPGLRGTFFGLLLALYFVGIGAVPGIGPLLGLTRALWVGLGAGVAQFLYVVLVLPESLRPEERERAAQEAESKARVELNPLRPLARVLMRSTLFRRLATVAFVLGVSQEGFQTIVSGFFQIRFSFTPADQGLYLSVVGWLGLVSQTVLLHTMLMRFGEVMTIRLSAGVLVVHLLGIAMAPTKVWVFVFGSLGSVAYCTFPAVSALKSNNAGDFEQGTVQGALFGAKALGQGVGPVLLGSFLFRKFTSESSTWPFFPQGAVYAAAAVAFVAFAVSFTLRAPRPAQRAAAPVEEQQALLA